MEILSSGNPACCPYRKDDPSIKICADQGSEEMVAWYDRFCSSSPDDPNPPICESITGGCGDLAVITVDNNMYGYLWSYDITDRNSSDPTAPVKWISSRLINDNGVDYGKLRNYEASCRYGDAFWPGGYIRS